MQDIDLECAPQGNGSRIWPEYRQISEQRMQAFRFSLGLLCIFSGALTWLLLQDVGPWICAPSALVMSALSVAFAGIEWQLGAKLRNLQALVPSHEGLAGGAGSKKARAWSAESGLERDSWPIYGAYAAFAALGLYYGSLPIVARQSIAKTTAKDEPNGKTISAQRPAATPYVRPFNAPPGTPFSFGNPRQFPGVTPIQVPPFVRPPVRTPPTLLKAASPAPAAVTATPRVGSLPLNSSAAKASPSIAPITPPPNAGPK